jgi:hypothetical protein
MKKETQLNECSTMLNEYIKQIDTVILPEMPS